MSIKAKAIYERLLNQTGRALVTRDLGAWVDALAIPHQMTTLEGKLMLESEKDVHIAFVDYVAALCRLSVNRMERACEIARFSDPDRIEGYHTTTMYKENHEALPTYTVKWVLVLDDAGSWRVSKSDSAIGQDTFSELPHCELTQFQREDTSTDARLRRTMQTFLDKIDTTFLFGNFDEWQNAYKLPFVVETAQGQKIVDGTAKLREEFTLYREACQINKVTDITRIVRMAEQVDEDLMLLTYRAHILNGPRYVVDPWNGAMTLRREGGRWHITKILRALGHLNWRAKHPSKESSEETAKTVHSASIIQLTPRTGRQK
ncbi:MAG: hypothetical protein AB8B58_00575 [Roseobacter sp.]